jgi:hypothetical protein
MDTQHPTAPPEDYRKALQQMIDIACEFAIAADRLDPQFDHLSAIRQIAAANAERAAEVSGEAIVIRIELDWIVAGAWALRAVADATADYWNQNGEAIARRLDAIDACDQP